MTVKELIKKLQEYPENAMLCKVSLLDDTGSSDSEMEPEDWSSATIKDANGKATDRVIVFCCFGELTSSQLDNCLLDIEG